MTVAGMINWLNAKSTYDKIVSILELRGAKVSIGAGAGSMQTLEACVDASDEWPRRFFIFDYSTREWKYVGHLGSVTAAWRFVESGSTDSMGDMINNSILYFINNGSSPAANSQTPDSF